MCAEPYLSGIYDLHNNNHFAVLSHGCHMLLPARKCADPIKHHSLKRSEKYMFLSQANACVPSKVQ